MFSCQSVYTKVLMSTDVKPQNCRFMSVSSERINKTEHYFCQSFGFQQSQYFVRSCVISAPRKSLELVFCPKKSSFFARTFVEKFSILPDVVPQKLVFCPKSTFESQYFARKKLEFGQNTNRKKSSGKILCTQKTE